MRVAITGGSSGIGAAVAAKLKQQGHHISAFDVNEPQSNVDDWIPLDLSDPQAIDAAIASVDGTFDALVNNAGLPPRDGLTEAILKVNYFGLKHFLNGMLDHLEPGARIVNVASRAGAQWRDNLDEVKALGALDIDGLSDFISTREMTPTRAYNLSKEAIIVMTMAQTEAMIARGFSMNSVSPAAVSTGILQDFATAFGDKMTKNVARTGRAGEPEEIAEFIVFLTSPESSWLKGQDIVIDGGMSALITSDALGL